MIKYIEEKGFVEDWENFIDDIGDKIKSPFYFSKSKLPDETQIEKLYFDDLRQMSYFELAFDEIFDLYEEKGSRLSAKEIIKNLEDWANYDDIGYSLFYGKPMNYFYIKDLTDKIYKIDYHGNISNIMKNKFDFDYQYLSDLSKDEIDLLLKQGYEYYKDLEYEVQEEIKQILEHS